MATVDSKPTINIDSKFRRETSNFKINFELSTPAVGEAVLIKYIEKKLEPEEFLGAVARLARYDNDGSLSWTTWAVEAVTVGFASDPTLNPTTDRTYRLCNPEAYGFPLFYVYNTGALSAVAPYRDNTGVEV